MKYVLCLIALAFLPAGVSAREEKFKAVAREVREDLGEARKEKALTRAETAQKRTSLKKEIKRLKEQRNYTHTDLTFNVHAYRVFTQSEATVRFKNKEQK